ncbi:Pyruvate/Phosphoenolpyruvate kinase-like domain-containing protein [Aspergillus alliaceus]|uniref:Pyruvate/Phosphoenolpyruvate kinase-like domain-containing protein n=1 Tax=Petromyces alliaceus TaxID=209559 RepID=A0A5N7CMY9_PETAA|nr:Pyruvate/Phosphoenolpyruvate kinase-like domain-containing protein [Aspergillus alliaceus]KAB8236630.1 Pyruvate/Phosphoenolpyruvate kinase-like domain-containing protein [Aspergillus alliaceus]KAE8395524.1 Pyruvate/Phosphoenolpyruvate kinase-like domain-containing protein [Aspergillus alliaceus]
MALNVALRSHFQRHSTAYGFWLTVPSGAVARTLLRSAAASPVEAFSWVLVDAEHGLITDRDYYELTTTVASEGASPIVRVPWGEEWMIKRALDSGAHGILTPMCHSPEDARRIVQYCKYPPVGSRGYGPLYAHHAFPGVQPGAQYDENADTGLLAMVQIESRSGVETVEEIAKVEGLDVLLIGPFDLAKQMGIVRGGEEHEAAIQRILRACKSAGKKAAIFCTDGAQAHFRAEQGFDMVSVITDQAAMGNAIVQSLSEAQGRGVENKPREGY